MRAKTRFEAETYAALLVFVENTISAYLNNTPNGECNESVNAALGQLSGVWVLLRQFEIDTEVVSDRYNWIFTQAKNTEQDAISYMACLMCIMDFMGTDSMFRSCRKRMGKIEANCQSINDKIERGFSYDASWDKGRFLWLLIEQQMKDWDAARRKLFIL